MNNQIKPHLERKNINTLHDLFKARIDTTPHEVAYSTFNQRSQRWQTIQWLEIFRLFVHMRNAIAAENLVKGDRVLVSLPNGIEWITIEQAAAHLGLIFVALNPSETAANINHIIDDTNPKLIFIESDTYLKAIIAHTSEQDKKVKIISMNKRVNQSNTTYFKIWLKNGRNFSPKEKPSINAQDIASIIYTSGTTGQVKGVMLSHESLLNNAFASFESVLPSSEDQFLSTTSASHIMERVAGYYVPMIAGAGVNFSKSEGSILEDLRQTNANILITTPYILDCAFQTLLVKYPILRKTISRYIEYINGEGKYHLAFAFWPIIKRVLSRRIKKQFIGNLSQIFCGGSSLSDEILTVSSMMDIPLLQGYGLTEAGGIVSVNVNQESQGVGRPLNNVSIDFEKDGELKLKSNSLMTGYWNNEDLTDKTLVDHTLLTGDLAKIENEHLYLVGRKSQLIQLANGKKVSAQPIEQLILKDKLFKNVTLFGESHEKLTLICQLCEISWAAFLSRNQTKNNEAEISEKNKRALLSVRINTLIKSLPDHHFIDFVVPTFDAWNAENGLLNMQGKVNSKKVEQHYSHELHTIYDDIYVRNGS